MGRGVQIATHRLRIDRGHWGVGEKHETSPSLDGRERREAVNRTAVNAATVHEAIRLEGEDELSRPPSALAWSGLAVGLSMGFSPRLGKLFPLSAAGTCAEIFGPLRSAASSPAG